MYSLRHPPATHECPQKISAIRSNRLAGYRQHTYIYINVFFYSIDIFIIITNIFSLYIGISYNLHIIDLLQWDPELWNGKTTLKKLCVYFMCVLCTVYLMCVLCTVYCVLCTVYCVFDVCSVYLMCVLCSVYCVFDVCTV